MCSSLTRALRLLVLLHVSVNFPTTALSGVSVPNIKSCPQGRAYGYPRPLGDINQPEVRQRIKEKCAGFYEDGITIFDGQQPRKEIILLLVSHSRAQVAILHNFVAQLRLLSREHYVVVRDETPVTALLLPAADSRFHTI